MNQEVSITKEQVQKEMKYFRRLFPIVRLLDGERLLRRNDGMEAEKKSASWRLWGMTSIR